MGFYRRKKGQAAIEFLMTYGWMLLVVLIVGALIFSFVDFGRLLPNQLDLTGTLRGDANRAVASSADSNIRFVITYLGSRASAINVGSISIDPEGGQECGKEPLTATQSINITNADTGASTSTDTGGGDVRFVNGQIGIVTINCAPNSLLKGDVVEGNLVISTHDQRTNLPIPSTGRVRIQIT